MLPYSDMPLRRATVTFHMKAVDDIQFRKFPGFILRSGFGAALRQLCRYRGSAVVCTNCRYREQCPYAFIFETPGPYENLPDFTAENFPHPFVMAPPHYRPYTVPAGQPFSVQFTLFGRGIYYLLFYIYAFDLLGDKGLGRHRARFILQRVCDSETGNELFSHKDKTLRQDPDIYDLSKNIVNADTDRIKLQFVTPAKLLKHNRSLEHLTTDSLIRALLRRASLLARLHENRKWQLDFRRIIEQFNKDINLVNNRTKGVKLIRYSVKQGRVHPLFAMTGSAELTGNLEPYMPLLSWGVYMQIGSSTSQALGKYVIEKT